MEDDDHSSVVDEDGWKSGITENYDVSMLDEKVRTMDENDVDYLDPMDSRNHAHNIIGDMKSTPSQTVKLRRRSCRDKSIQQNENSVIETFKTISGNECEWVCDEDYDRPEIVVEALMEVDLEHNVNEMKTIETLDPEWIPTDEEEDECEDEEVEVVAQEMIENDDVA